MIDFKQARETAFEIVKNTRTVEKVSEETKNKNGTTKLEEFWRVLVEVPVEDRIKEFTLEVNLKFDFPLSLPSIRLSEADYEKTKYLPHIDSKRGICLYDQENIKQNTADPAGIVNECINQAVRILTDGLNKDRLAEFNDEVIAYWENTYHKDDSVIAAYLGSNMRALPPGAINAYYLVQPHANVNLYIGNKEDETERLVSFFKLRGHSLQNIEAFYVGEIGQISPPFYYDSKSLLTLVKNQFSEMWKDFKSYLNRNNPLKKLILFSVVSGGSQIFFGFYLPPFRSNFNGWRSGQSSVQIMSTIKPAEPVIRVRFIEFHPERLQVRTDGLVHTFPSKKIMLAGLGSVGSHLLFYLSSLNISKYVLVDPEILVIENINRHLLSFSEVGMNKVDAMAKYLRYNNPFLDFSKYPSSIVEVLRRSKSEINDLDLIFCAIGKDAIEAYVLEHIAKAEINKPVFLFWVEPYLLGAHVLYIRPGTNFSLSDLDINGFYKYNVLAIEAYKDPDKKISLREAGCQGSYMPYGKSDILRYFSVLTPHLFDIIENPPNNNLAITYVGNLNIAASLDLPLSAFANSFSSHQIFIQSI